MLIGHLFLFRLFCFTGCCVLLLLFIRLRWCGLGSLFGQLALASLLPGFGGLNFPILLKPLRDDLQP